MERLKHVHVFRFGAAEVVLKQDTKKHRWAVFLNGEQIEDLSFKQGLAVLSVLRAIKSVPANDHMIIK